MSGEYPSPELERNPKLPRCESCRHNNWGQTCQAGVTRPAKWVPTFQFGCVAHQPEVES
jgi:hypothetical protein